MITRFEIAIRPASDWAVLPADHGYQVKGLVYGWLKAGDAAVSARIHEGAKTATHKGSGPNPFSCSHVLGLSPPQDGVALVTRHRLYTLRVTSLNAAAGRALERGMERAGSHVKLAGVPFDVAGMRIASQTDYGELMRTPQAEAWVVRFLSPTSFTTSTAANREMPVLLPLPYFIFQSLALRWNAFAPDDVPHVSREFVRMMQDHVCVTRLANVWTAPNDAPPEARGFVGEVELRLMAQLEQADFVLMCALLRYAPYAGIGGRTSDGRGLVEAEALPEPA